MFFSRRDMLKATGASAGVATTAIAQEKPAPGYGRDPNLIEPTVPWPMTLSPDQRATIRALVEVALPATDDMPAGSELNLDAFIDEWVSAPYPDQRRDRDRVLRAITALNGARGAFSKLGGTQRTQVLDALLAPGSAAEPDVGRLIALLFGGYASSDRGMEAIGYRGNVPLERFDGPPPEVHARLEAAAKALAARKA
jgi:hypothetical protein